MTKPKIVYKKKSFFKILHVINIFAKGNKVLLVSTRQLSAEVSYGGFLYILHQIGRECQNYVIIVLTPILEFLM